MVASRSKRAWSTGEKLEGEKVSPVFCGVVFASTSPTACARGPSRDDPGRVRTRVAVRSHPLHSRAAERGRRGSSIDHARARRRAASLAISRPARAGKKTLTAIPGKAGPRAGVWGPVSDTHLSNLLLELREGGAIVLNDLLGRERGEGSVSVSSRRQSMARVGSGSRRKTRAR